MRLRLRSYVFCIILIMHATIRTGVSGPATESNNLHSNSIFTNQFPINLQNHQLRLHHPHHHQHQHQQFGVDKPSKLRLYLLADLAKAAAEAKPFLNCESSVELKVNTKNCTCNNYTCQRFYKSAKKPRIFERSCEDVCCGKQQRFKGKSLLDGEEDKKIIARSVDALPAAAARSQANSEDAVAVHCGEIIPDKNDKLIIPWIVQISSTGQDRCIGSLLSSRAVITSINCIDKSNKISVTRFTNSTAVAEHLPVKEIIQDDLVEKSVILVLNEPVPVLDKNMNPCLPQDNHQLDYSPNCYLGLPNRIAAPVRLLPRADCDKVTANPQISRNSICVQYHYLSEEHTGPGAPLICNWDAKYPKNFQIVGVLSEKFNDILVFDNINRIENMIKLNLNILM